LITATTAELEKVRGMVARGKLKGNGDIGVRVGKVVNKYKVAKHFKLAIADHSFDYSLRRYVGSKLLLKRRSMASTSSVPASQAHYEQR
jgi:hypothetical protein